MENKRSEWGPNLIHCQLKVESKLSTIATSKLLQQNDTIMLNFEILTPNHYSDSFYVYANNKP